MVRHRQDEDAAANGMVPGPKRLSGRGKEVMGFMQEKTALKRSLKAAGICVMTALLFLLTGCMTGKVFDGTRVSDASAFRMEYSMLNREESADLSLMEGDRLQVSLSHTEGYADVTIGMEGNKPVYRGNGQIRAEFTLEISESGTYHISVSGHLAKGSVSFVRIPGGAAIGHAGLKGVIGTERR